MTLLLVLLRHLILNLREVDVEGSVLGASMERRDTIGSLVNKSNLVAVVVTIAVKVNFLFTSECHRLHTDLTLAVIDLDISLSLLVRNEGVLVKLNFDLGFSLFNTAASHDFLG